jgi:hypothetical protein
MISKIIMWKPTTTKVIMPKLMIIKLIMAKLAPPPPMTKLIMV